MQKKQRKRAKNKKREGYIKNYRHVVTVFKRCGSRLRVVFPHASRRELERCERLVPVLDYGLLCSTVEGHQIGLLIHQFVNTLKREWDTLTCGTSILLAKRCSHWLLHTVGLFLLVLVPGLVPLLGYNQFAMLSSSSSNSKRGHVMLRSPSDCALEESCASSATD